MAASALATALWLPATPAAAEPSDDAPAPGGNVQREAAAPTPATSTPALRAPASREAATGADAAPTDAAVAARVAGAEATPAAEASAAAAPAAEAGQPAWLPLEPGLRWEYAWLRERTRETGRQTQVEKQTGTLLEEVLSRDPVGRAQLRLSVSAEPSGGGAPISEVEMRIVEAMGDGIALFERERRNPLSGNQEVLRFEPPLRWLAEDGAGGQSWSVGESESGGLTTKLSGRVLGVQDAVTPSGVFEKCLVLHITGTVEGVTEAYGERIEIREGRIEWTEWYAPGVGRVLVKHRLEQQLVRPDSEPVLFSEEIQYGLRSRPAPASPQ